MNKLVCVVFLFFACDSDPRHQHKKKREKNQFHIHPFFSSPMIARELTHHHYSSTSQSSPPLFPWLQKPLQLFPNP